MREREREKFSRQMTSGRKVYGAESLAGFGFWPVGFCSLLNCVGGFTAEVRVSLSLSQWVKTMVM